MFINERGGVARAHFMTKFLLAIHGEYEYPSLSFANTNYVSAE